MNTTGKKRGRPKGRPTGHVRVDREVKEMLQVAARSCGLTVTEFTNRAVAARLGITWPPNPQS